MSHHHHSDELDHPEDLDLADVISRSTFSRRRALIALGGGIGAGMFATALGGRSALAASLIPEETGGPYPADGSNGPNVLVTSGIVRSDIRSSFGQYSGTAEGVPFTVTFKLVDVTNDGALVGYAVYLWHCDRDGDYSLYSQGITNQNYLRGVQVTDDNGEVTFTTIFPACYDGRWPHMHFEVFDSLASATSSTNAVRTSQVALPAAACAEVYAESGYEESVTNFSRVSLATDNVFRDDSAATQMATVTGSVAAGYHAVLEVGLDADGAGVTVAAGEAELTVTPTSSPATIGLPSAYVALDAPSRLLDTRSGVGYSGTKPAAQSAFSLAVAGRGGVPASGVSAVVLNVTITEGEAPGYVTVWPSGAQPTASSLNVDAAGQTRANLVTVPVDSGAVRLYTHSAAHLVADVVGYYTPADTSRAGRTQFVTPSRILDTRTGSKPGAGQTLDVTVLGRGGVPSTGVAAVVLNVTATETAGAGFVTANPTSTPPTTSNVNYVGAGTTASNMVLATVGDSGTVPLYVLTASHLVVDVFAWITDDTADDTDAGLFVPVSPYRVADTRTLGGLAAGGTLHLLAAASGTAAAGYSGLDLNVTATDPAANGYVTVWPEGDRPAVSNLNVLTTAPTVANHVVTGVGADGGIEAYTLNRADVIVDVTGWYV